MSEIFTLLPDPEILLALEIEELAGYVLEYLNSREGSNSLNRNNISMPYVVHGYPQERRDEVHRAIMEGWMWLERESLIALRPGGQGNWYFITKRGLRLANAQGIREYRRADLLPREFLHPIIAQRVWTSFLQGDYGTAVFLAFRGVEIEVRNAGNFGANDYGVSLMRSAFHIDNGPLTDRNAPRGERDSILNLFAGAIGYYKNPLSHRDVVIEDPVEAAEMIILASHLMKIIDTRRNQNP